MNAQTEQAIIEKLKQLPPERVAEVEDFVDFLRSRDAKHSLTKAVGKLSEAALAKVWDNESDADYDRL